MSYPLVTVCMPTYNQEKYVAEAIESILQQDYEYIQVIISDDCSQDNTYEICKKYKNEFPEIITLQRHSKNLGISGNVNSIYPLIKGKYVCWFSGDDLYSQKKISSQVRIMQEHADCVFSFHRSLVIDDTGNNLYEFNDSLIGLKLFESDIAENLLKHRCYISAISVMINRDLAAEVIHNDSFGRCSDWVLLCEMAMKGHVIFLPEVLAAYRRHTNNISKILDITHEENAYAYMVHRYPDYKKYIKIGKINLYTLYYFKYLLAKQYKQAFRCKLKLIQEIAAAPIYIPTVIHTVILEIYKRLCMLMVTGNIVR